MYGLGKGLYEMLTGKDRQEFPALPKEFLGNTGVSPTGPGDSPNGPAGHNSRSNGMPAGLGNAKSIRRLLTELNQVILCACESNRRLRYASARAMRDDFERLQQGQSVKRRRLSAQGYSVAKGAALAAVALSLLLAGAVTWLRTARIDSLQNSPNSSALN